MTNDAGRKPEGAPERSPSPSALAVLRLTTSSYRCRITEPWNASRLATLL